MLSREVSRHQFGNLWRNEFLEKIPQTACSSHYYIVLVMESKETKQKTVSKVKLGSLIRPFFSYFMPT